MLSKHAPTTFSPFICLCTSHAPMPCTHNHLFLHQNWHCIDFGVNGDDGISGVTFDRPGVQRLLEDAKAGNINLILCKDMSRFGRNYIAVGQYVDYLFPMYNIRFIALTDNIDTLYSDSASMDMLPIMNVFNEWFAANTSKKLRAVFESNARSGKYKTTFAAYENSCDYCNDRRSHSLSVCRSA